MDFQFLVELHMGEKDTHLQESSCTASRATCIQEHRDSLSNSHSDKEDFYRKKKVLRIKETNGKRKSPDKKQKAFSN